MRIRILLITLIGCLLLAGLPACYKLGRATGRAVHKTEKGIKKVTNSPKKFEKGYKSGR